jgi:hypothetical protein
MTKASFRTLVVLSAVSGMLGLLVALASEQRLPTELRKYLESQHSVEATTTDWVLLFVFVPLALAGVASFIGMLRFATWSRPLAVGTSLVGLAGLPLFGPTVEPGTTTALYHLGSMFFGATIAVSYFSPAAPWFRKDSTRMRADVRIWLDEIAGPVIIVPAATGVVYCNQVDGVACVHRELEGFLLPLPVNRASIFSPDWWYRSFNRRCAGDTDVWNEAMAELARTVETGEEVIDLRVESHPENSEAWVHVSFSLRDSGQADALAADGRIRGVLTWENCD